MLPSTRPSPVVDRVSISASLLLHAGTLALVMLALGPHAVMLGPTLPALMLYAPDRRPDAPRDAHIPSANPLGAVDDPAAADGGALGSTRRPAVPARANRLAAMPHEVLEPTLARHVTFDSVFSVLAVDSQVIREPGTVAPRYPAALMEARVEGAVDVEFVVDTTGRVDVTTVEILNSSHPEFTASVETALSEMKFRPAWRSFRHVRQRVTQRFTFRLNSQLPPSQPN